MRTLPKTIRREIESLDVNVIARSFYNPHSFTHFLEENGGRMVTCRTDYSSGFGNYTYHMRPQAVTLAYSIEPRKKSTHPFSDEARIEICIEGSDEGISEIEQMILDAEKEHKAAA